MKNMGTLNFNTVLFRIFNAAKYIALLCTILVEPAVKWKCQKCLQMLSSKETCMHKADLSTVETVLKTYNSIDISHNFVWSGIEICSQFFVLMSISFPEHTRSRVSGAHSSGETNFSRTISHGWRMLLDDYHQIAIHIRCGPTRGLIVFHRNLLKFWNHIHQRVCEN